MLKTKGQIKDQIAKSITKFYVTTLGVGPRETRVYIVEDMVIIRLEGKLLPIEEKLLESTAGIKLIKDIRKALHEITTENISRIIKKITSYKVISSHSDISTKTGEIAQIYIMDVNLEEQLETKFG